VASTSAFVWDWVMSLEDEYRLLQGGLSLPIVIYFLSRIGTLGFGITSVIFQAAPVSNCHVFQYIRGAFYILAQFSTSSLFFLRVRAVCSNSRVITSFFGFMLIVNSVLTASVLQGIDGAQIGRTNICITTAIHTYASIPLVMYTVYDTLVFLVISWNLVFQPIVGETWSARMRCFITGDGLSWLSKGLLQSGQLYYMVSVVLNIFMCVLVLTPNIPEVYRLVLSIPSVALPSIVACRVFRTIKLAFIEQQIATSFMVPISQLQFTPTIDIILTTRT